MISAQHEHGPERRWRWAVALLAAVALASGFWAVSWHRIATWLDDDARMREARWQDHGAAWRWSFDPARDIIWPGSHGLATVSASDRGLQGTVPTGAAEFSLALRGERVDAGLLAHAVLEIETSRPARVLLLGDAQSAATILADGRIEPGRDNITLPMPIESGANLEALRLRIETDAESRITLREVSLVMRGDLSIHDCTSLPGAEATLRGCPARLPRLIAPNSLRPESVLAWRDAIRIDRPGAIVRAPAWVPTADAVTADPLRTFAQRLPERAPLLVLAILPLCAVVMSRLRRSPSPLQATAELGLVFLPWLILLWNGWPADDNPVGVAAVLLASLAGALLLRSLASPWGWIGDHVAWRAGARSTLIAAALIVAAASMSVAVGATSFGRPVDPDKFWIYPLWALLQQTILIRTITPHLRLATGSDLGGAIAAGALFGLLHLPNLSLMLATFAAGSVWSWLGQRHRALLPLVISHAVLGLILVWLAPAWLLRSAEIGGRFLMAP